MVIARFKAGKFTHPVTVAPGYGLVLTLTEHVPIVRGELSDLSERVQTHSETFDTEVYISHWVMYSLVQDGKGIGAGGIFGDQNMVDGVRAGKVFCNVIEVSEKEKL
jgi:hypothetical protein